MRGLRIKDLAEGGYLAFDLRDLLSVIAAAAESSRWRCTDLWCIPIEPIGEGELKLQYDSGSLITGSTLSALAERTRQVIDGEFRAYRGSPTSEEAWLVIRAVDSSFWEVFSDDDNVLRQLRVRFHDVQDLAADAA